MDISFRKKVEDVLPYLNAKENDPHAHLAKLIHRYSKLNIYRAPVIDENLNVISRWGVKWWTRVVLNSVTKLFGCDLLASVRADRVAQGILRKFQEERVEDKAPLIRSIDSDVLDRLNKKTKEKYQAAISQVKEEFKKLFPEPVIQRPEEPQGAIPDENGFIWPPKLSDICLDEALKVKVGQVYQEVIKANLKNSSRIRKKEIVQGLNLQFFYNQDKTLKDVQLKTEREFARGKFRRVFLCYSLSKGQYFVKKDSPTQEERDLLNKWVETPQRGLELVFDISRVSKDGEKDKEKWEIIERCRAGVLATLFDTKPLADPSQQKLLIEDLLCGLDFLHSQPKIVNFVQKEGEDAEQQTFLFHGDISPANILIENESGRWQAVISDFDATGRFTCCAGTPGFRSPETVNFINRTSNKKGRIEILEFNFRYGQKKDIWSMGLVILSILCGRRGEGVKNTLPEAFRSLGSRDIKEMNVPPLPSLEAFLCEPKDVNREVDAKIVDLTQEILDRDLGALHEEYDNFHGKNKGVNANLWELVKGMLKVAPDGRISAKEALLLLQNG